MKAKILMITPYLPYHSQAGGQTRSFYLIKHLSKNNLITLVCFTRDKTGLSELKKYCQKVVIVKRGKTWDLKKILRTGFSLNPFLISNYLDKTLKQKIRQELDSQKYDLIHSECFYLMPNIPKSKTPVILVDQTIEYAVYQHFVESLKGWKSLLKPLLWIDVLKLKFWETYYWKHTHTVTAVSQEDRQLMSKLSGRSDIQLINNGVSQTFFKTKKGGAKTKYPSILFGVSNMKWMQNKEAVFLLLKDIWPKIKQAIPSAKLFIIGRHSPQVFKNYQSSDIIIKEADQKGLKHDPQYYYQKSWILLAPIKSGGGSRTKFFEAMASRLAIVTTKQGIEGIAAKNQVEAVVSPYQKLASASIKLLKNKQKRKQIGQSAHQLCLKQYSWSKSAQSLNQLYQKIIKSNEK
ncbi:hypothetical protein DRH14_01370 [Candidatus Shapirobacteria bacterium]|nr:MAG: hypothetical protein DRH14_01370 [Candidatus Shapirobacteria bacterium]